ncbi:MAG: heavy-metal-associated domain-containing protein [Saprospiraceae bacterium]|nr:heavy-metal-associated domain-containing protein [Saprospiraceae bacterium]
MKFFFLINMFLISLFSQNSADNAMTMTTKFKVYGNCGMCEKRIEKAAKIEGVISADWDKETHMISVVFDEKRVKPSQIHAAIAAVGHDTDKVRADDSVYASLHECCQYDRAKQ